MRRFFLFLLLSILSVQFSWAAVAAHCGHETQVGAEHFGHHKHQRQAGTGGAFGPDANLDANPDTGDGTAPGATDAVCVQCDGTASMTLSVPSALPGVASTVSPNAALDESGGAHAPSRPERPQWRPFA